MFHDLQERCRSGSAYVAGAGVGVAQDLGGGEQRGAGPAPVGRVALPGLAMVPAAGPGWAQARCPGRGVVWAVGSLLGGWRACRARPGAQWTSAAGPV